MSLQNGLGNVDRLEAVYGRERVIAMAYSFTDKKRIRQGKVIPREAPYLVVYPFVKRRPWYFLTFEERAEAMRELSQETDEATQETK